MPSHRPFVTCGDAEALCKEIYHLEASCKELVSYDDRNFLVTAGEGAFLQACKCSRVRASQSAGRADCMHTWLCWIDSSTWLAQDQIAPSTLETQ